MSCFSFYYLCFSVEKQPEKPTIDLSHIKPITVKAGNDLKIAVPITGHPPPTVSWEKDGKPVDSPLTKLEVHSNIFLHLSNLFVLRKSFVFTITVQTYCM